MGVAISIDFDDNNSNAVPKNECGWGMRNNYILLQVVALYVNHQSPILLYRQSIQLCTHVHCGQYQSAFA